MSEENIKSLEHVKVSVSSIIDKANKDTEFGKFKYYVQTHWEGGTLCKNQIRRAHKLLVDEPPAFGGDDLSASPVELILAALGSCQQIMFSALASVRDIPLEECDITLKAKLDVRGLLGIQGEKGAVFPGFSEITYTTNIKSSAPRDQLEALIRDVENQCPVMDMLTRKVNVVGSTVINDDEFDVAMKSSLSNKILEILKRKKIIASISSFFRS